MSHRSRRDFLADVGRGMLVASLGSATAIDLGITPCAAEEPTQRLTFGQAQPLVGRCSCRKLPRISCCPTWSAKLKTGTDLKTLVTSAARERPRLRWPRLHRLPHVHGPRAGLSDRR